MKRLHFVEQSLLRGMALFAGMLLAIGAVGTARGWAEAGAILVDARRFGVAGIPILVGLAAALIVGGVRSTPLGIRIARVGLAMLALWACVDSIRFWRLIHAHEIDSLLPVPFSIVVAGAAMLAALRLRALDTSWRWLAGVVVMSGVWAAMFPFGVMIFAGRTDYRQPSDMALVFGARAYADGRASDALEDRMLAACDVIREGFAPVLVVSGGPGDGDFHETDVMRRIALEQGLDEGQIIVDRNGMSTRDSVEFAAHLARERGFTRAIAVSHFYHVPRIRLEASRLGLDVRTVPASQRGRILKALPWFMFRESAAWWRTIVRNAIL